MSAMMITKHPFRPMHGSDACWECDEHMYAEIHQVPQPAPDAEGEWKHGINREYIYDANGEGVAVAYTAGWAEKIIRDHTLAASVPKLVEALQRRVSPTKCYCDVMLGARCGECVDRELLTSLGAQIQEKQ